MKVLQGETQKKLGTIIQIERKMKKLCMDDYIN
jgi:hypothetical protein